MFLCFFSTIVTLCIASWNEYILDFKFEIRVNSGNENKLIHFFCSRYCTLDFIYLLAASLELFKGLFTSFIRAVYSGMRIRIRFFLSVGSGSGFFFFSVGSGSGFFMRKLELFLTDLWIIICWQIEGKQWIFLTV